MPSKKSKTRARQKNNRLGASSQAVLYPLIIFALIVWVIYRILFDFPVWFDESIGKAIFFGLPVWLYISGSGNAQVVESFDFNKIRPGLLLGLAVGGLYGFVAAITVLLVRSSGVMSVALFSSTFFWWEFLLALLTGFWESLFFFSFIMTGVLAKHRSWSVLQQVMWVALIFLIFHLPNTILRFSGLNILTEFFLLYFFAMGQAFVFYRRRNFYTLVISQAIWGMVLLVHV